MEELSRDQDFITKVLEVAQDMGELCHQEEMCVNCFAQGYLRENLNAISLELVQAMKGKTDEEWQEIQSEVTTMAFVNRAEAHILNAVRHEIRSHRDAKKEQDIRIKKLVLGAKDNTTTN